ncbi:MAG: TlpA family protein disulfide reductase [Gemmatimonadetes bacterium]|nr:TlpA family protein disulfide reductase [Gemmatimonadota bacterium]
MGRNWQRLSFALATAALAGLFLAAWLNRERFLPVDVGSAAPAFQAFDLEGHPVRLSDFAGRVVLLNIWATWCLPCKTEMPSLQRLHEHMADKGFQVVAVSVDARLGDTDVGGRPGGNIGAFADSLALTFTVLHDPSGRIQDLYRTTGVPESFVIGRDGLIYKKVIGATEWDAPEYQALIERLLEG